MTGLPAGVPSDQSAHSSLLVPPGASSAFQNAVAYMQAASVQAQAQYAVQMAGGGSYRHQQYAQPPAASQQQQQQAPVPAPAPAAAAYPRRNVRCFCGLAAERGSMVQCQVKQGHSLGAARPAGVRA